MFTASFKDEEFMKDMTNVINYSIGFLDGIRRGKPEFLRRLGLKTVEAMKFFIDSNARVNPQALQHMYEWYQNGTPEGRLFDIDYIVNSTGLTISSTISQSKTIQNGSRVPFYDKARIMEEGIPVTIKPKNSEVLVFTNSDGEQVFSRSQISVRNPGGDQAQGSFERTIDLFIEKYFTQSWIHNSGILEYLEKPIAYKRNLSAGKKAGRSKGLSVGYDFIVGGGAII